MESNLEKFRSQINQIDAQLLELLTARQDIVDNVSKIKASSLSKSFLMPKREKEMLKKLTTNSNLNNDIIEYIWRGIISNSLYSEQEFSIHINNKINDQELQSYFPYFVPKIKYKNTNMEIAKIKKNPGDLIVLSYDDALEHHKILKHNEYLCFKNFTNDKSLIFARIDKEFLAKERFVYIIDDSNLHNDAKILSKQEHYSLVETVKRNEVGFFLGSY